MKENRFSRFVSVLLIATVLLVSAFAALAAGSDMMMTLYTGTSATTGADYGWNVTYGGDFNNDSYPDVLIGAPGEDSAYLFLGPVDTLDPTMADATFTEGSSSEFGWAVAWAGDVNNDGYDDIIIGAPGEDKAYVYVGGPSVDTNADINISGEASTRFGHSVASLGNFNIDLANEVDLAVGAPLADPDADADKGQVYLFCAAWRASRTTGDLDYVTCNLNITGINAGDQFGFSLTSGLFSQDEVPDLLVGAPYFDVPNSPSPFDNAGGAFYLVGQPVFPIGSLMDPMPADAMSVNIYGPTDDALFGWSVTNLTDFTGSNFQEMAIGAPGSFGTGEVYIFSDSTISMSGNIINLTAGGTYDHMMSGDSTGDKFGFDVSWAGNLDGLNSEDVAIGAPGAAGNGTVYAYYTPFTNKNMGITAAGAMLVGENAGDMVGFSVCAALNATYRNTSVLLAGAPGMGAGGTAYILEANALPQVSYSSSQPANPGMGNTSTQILIRCTYMDRDGDPANSVMVHIYNMTDGGTELADSPFNMTTTNMDPDYKSGVLYSYMDTFPHGDFSMQFEFNASEGDTSMVTSPMIDNKLNIDGLPPGKVPLWNETGILNTSLWDYSIELHFTWPGDNGMNTSGKVEQLELRYSNTTVLTEANFKTEGKLLDDKIYDEFQQELVNTEWWLVQPPKDAGTEQVILIKGLDPEQTYHFAVRGRDDRWNYGPLSDCLSVMPYELPDDEAPEKIYGLEGFDTPDDDGGSINLTWWASGDEKFGHYNVYISQSMFTDVSAMTPVMMLDEVDNVTIAVDGLANGQYYYFAVTAVDRAGNEDKLDVDVIGPIRCLDNNDDAPPVMTGVTATDVAADNGGAITVSWVPVTIPDFDSYKVYVKTTMFTQIDVYTYEVMITNMTQSSTVITTIDGTPLVDGQKYYFAVTCRDHNHIENMTITDSMWDGPLFAKNNSWTTAPNPLLGVSAMDTPNDDGGSITVLWDQSADFTFGFYRIYLSLTDITSASTVTGLTLVDSIAFKNTVQTEIDMFEGAALVDGTTYYGVVTVENWHGVENKGITDNNWFMIEPIDNGDVTAPGMVQDFAVTEVTDSGGSDTGVNITWTPFTTTSLPDFNRYQLNYQYGTFDVDPVVEQSEVMSVDIYDITESYATLNYDSQYVGSQIRFNITAFDDNDNMAEYTVDVIHTVDVIEERINVTISANPTGEVQVGTEIVLTIALGDGYDIADFVIKWDYDNEDGYWWDNVGSAPVTEGGSGTTVYVTYTTAGDHVVTVWITDGENDQQETLVLTVVEDTEPPAEDKKGPLDYWYLFVVAFLILIVLVGVLAFTFKFVYMKKPEPEQKPAPKHEKPKHLKDKTPPKKKGPKKQPKAAEAEMDEEDLEEEEELEEDIPEDEVSEEDVEDEEPEEEEEPEADDEDDLEDQEEE